MADFKLKIDVDPKDIPALDDSHKRDCADALSGEINRAFKYSLIFSVTVMAFFAVYAFFSFIWLLRMQTKLPQLSPYIPLAAAAICIFGFFLGTMNRGVLILEVLFHIVAAAAAVIHPQSILAAPFALYGAFLHIKLLTLFPTYKAISEQPGYPEFMQLPSKNTSKAQDENSENPSKERKGGSDGAKV